MTDNTIPSGLPLYIIGMILAGSGSALILKTIPHPKRTTQENTTQLLHLPVQLPIGLAILTTAALLLTAFIPFYTATQLRHYISKQHPLKPVH